MTTTSDILKPAITVYNNKAYCLVELGKVEEALPIVNKAFELDETKYFIWDTRGEINYKLGYFDKCESDMNMAIGINTESENSYYFRGLAKIKLGKNVDGCSDLNKASSLKKNEATEAIKMYCK